MLMRRFAASSSLSDLRPSRLRFSRFESRVYFRPLMKRRSLPDNRAYSLFRTSSKAKTETAAGLRQAGTMPRFSAPSGPLPAARRAADSTVTCRISPIQFHEEPFSLCAVRNPRIVDHLQKSVTARKGA